MTTTLHATALVLFGYGVLIRGASGAGKSLLALALIEHSQRQGDDPRLIGDDRVRAEIEGDSIVLHGTPGFEGQIELRGRGIIRRPFTQRTTLHLVIDLVDDLPRLPPLEAFTGEVLGRGVPRAPVPAGDRADLAHKVLLVAEALAALDQETRPEPRMTQNIT